MQKVKLTKTIEFELHGRINRSQVKFDTVYLECSFCNSQPEIRSQVGVVWASANGEKPANWLLCSDCLKQVDEQIKEVA